MNLRKGFSAALALALLTLGPACAGAPAASQEVRQIVSTTSFGMCAGYCTTRLEVSDGQAVLVRQARGGRGALEMPEQRIAKTLTPDEWRAIARLAETTELDDLPPVIGCPDCADGGAESLSIVRSSDTRTVTFDHGARIEQAQPLLDRLRDLRARMTAQ